jgi:hypothetical protein
MPGVRVFSIGLGGLALLLKLGMVLGEEGVQRALCGAGRTMVANVGISTKKMFEAAVSLYGVTDYANSELEDPPIRARVELHELAKLGIDDCDPLALLIPLCASSLLSHVRHTPALVPPLMTVVGACADALIGGDVEAARLFRVRDVVKTDPELLNEDILRFGSNCQMLWMTWRENRQAATLWSSFS